MCGQQAQPAHVQLPCGCVHQRGCFLSCAGSSGLNSGNSRQLAPFVSGKEFLALACHCGERFWFPNSARRQWGYWSPGGAGPHGGGFRSICSEPTLRLFRHLSSNPHPELTVRFVAHRHVWVRCPMMGWGWGVGEQDRATPHFTDGQFEACPWSRSWEAGDLNLQQKASECSDHMLASLHHVGSRDLLPEVPGRLWLSLLPTF